MKMFRKVLFANRGEIALRVVQACRELGVQTVAVYSTADRESLHVVYADEEVCSGPPPSTESYLNVGSLIAAAEITGADAIHPGYGFLSENAAFAAACAGAGLTFVGPPAAVIAKMGSKIDARRLASEAGVPVVAIGTDCLELDAQLLRAAFAILRTHDAVFGPATDGGYYLVGTARYLDGFFDAVRWSSSDTLADHTTQCANRGFSFELLPARADIDTWDDWLAYCCRVGRTP
jgi:acetyl-CoA carboxylase biotin carboxylase subunit